MAPQHRDHRRGAARRRALLTVLAGTLALLTVACRPIQPIEPPPERQDVTGELIEGRAVQEGGDLVMALSSEPDGLDPTTSSSLYTRYVMSSICEKLYDIDPAGEIVPQLAAEMPTFSDGGRTVTIPLREGITFADGEPFDAEAVRTTLDRHLNHELSSRAGELGPITDIEAVDERTVRLTYDEPFAPLTASLADRAGMIMSPAALEELGDDFASNPVCVGPFKFVERVPQTSITVERDPRYYAADEVRLDTITYRIITDANIRSANLRSGDVQVADTISPQDVDALRREDGIGVLQVGSYGYQALTVNLGNVDGAGTPPGRIEGPLANDPRVREALSASIDREALVNSTFNNWHEPACSPISPDSRFSTPASEACPEHDPERARRLLEEAGVQTPFPVHVKVADAQDGIRLAQALQASVAEGGFAMTIEAVEYSTLLDEYARGDFEAFLGGWSGRVDPHGNMFDFLTTGGSNNYAGYSHPQVDELMTAATRTTDPAERAQTYGEVVTQVQEDNPIIYLYRLRNLTGYTEDVAGVETYADGVVRLSRAAFLAEED
ncbi:ABC transporter substrate-binding protein [Georgenia alba]|uniref:ABC transporter substrate-binding protein n=1 Tax=Georgenia alba TaxID=2233858 RepID=A0ABW2Q1W5_9MICO